MSPDGAPDEGRETDQGRRYNNELPSPTGLYPTGDAETAQDVSERTVVGDSFPYPKSWPYAGCSNGTQDINGATRLGCFPGDNLSL